MNKRRLKEFALVAEVVSGAAIVVTLLFLAIEMRGNTNAIRAQTYQTLMQQLNDYRMQLVDENRIAANEKRRQNGWNSLTRLEKQAIRFPAMVNFGIYESAYFANERDVLGEAEWRRFEIAICRQYSAMQYLWNPDGFTSMDDLLTPQFAEYVHSSCAQAEND